MHSLIYFSQQFYGAGTTTSPFLEVKKEEKSWGFKMTSLSFFLKFPCYGNCNLLGAMNNRVWGKTVFLVCVCRVRFKDLRNVCLMLKKWNLKGFDRIFMIDSQVSYYYVTIWRWIWCRNRNSVIGRDTGRRCWFGCLGWKGRLALCHIFSQISMGKFRLLYNLQALFGHRIFFTICFQGLSTICKINYLCRFFCSLQTISRWRRMELTITEHLRMTLQGFHICSTLKLIKPIKPQKVGFVVSTL